MTRTLGLGEVKVWKSRWGEGMTKIAKKSRWTKGMNHRWGECLGEPRIPRILQEHHPLKIFSFLHRRSFYLFSTLFLVAEELKETSLFYTIVFKKS